MTIKATPTAGLSYSPLDPHYFDADKLHMELERVFDICHGCRLCFNLCPSFPALFQSVDQYDGDVTRLTAAQTAHVVDTCYQCKVCYIKCPYTPDDGHEFQLDFPRLMARAKAQRVRRRGLALRERMLGNPDLIGRLATLLPGMAALTNLGNRIAPLRWLMEKVAGIHRHKILPDLHAQSFQAWFDRQHGKRKLDGDNGKVFLFTTCFVNFNNPDVGKAAIAVFEKNNLTVKCDYKQCCGMPALDGGDVATAQKLARANVAQLMPYVREGYTILAVNPTCSMMLRKEYPALVGGEDARALAAAVMDPNEYLNTLRKDGRLNTDFRSTPGAINYHVPCHLRAQNIGYRSRDMLRSIGGGTEVELVAECCGHDGTWAMKKEFFEMSLHAGRKAFDGMRGEALMATDCPLAALQFQQATGTRPLHPLQILERAYRDDGFPTPVAPRPPES
ncbi:MAG: 4Fe-4S dicluster domain-containing protein [Candidatus Lambdaproteobacteria bacterium]|nr:4Fe-4S dicluster domain-containing protein [Candidatus Lambdaproteobacteria bacterium]